MHFAFHHDFIYKLKAIIFIIFVQILWDFYTLSACKKIFLQIVYYDIFYHLVFTNRLSTAIIIS